jgi:hypothetical protein
LNDANEDLSDTVTQAINGMTLNEGPDPSEPEIEYDADEQGGSAQ